jgi:hypothetical protein
MRLKLLCQKGVQNNGGTKSIFIQNDAQTIIQKQRILNLGNATHFFNPNPSHYWVSFFPTFMLNIIFLFFFRSAPSHTHLHSEFPPDMEQDHHANKRQRCDQDRRRSHLQSRTIVGVKLKNIRGPPTGASVPSGASYCCGFACLCLKRGKERLTLA